MANIKEYNVKLKSLTNTRKITKTMKMVSASKLRKAQEAQASAKEYAHRLTQLISRITSTVNTDMHPFLDHRNPVRNVLILIITSDKGLCGAFNHNANKCVSRWLSENRPRHDKVEISFCGKRGLMFFGKREVVKDYYEGVTISPKFETALKIGEDIGRYFTNKEYDEVYLTYNHFFSPLSQKTVFEKILPIDPKALIREDIERPSEYIFEPDPVHLLEFLVHKFLYFKIYFALLENSAGEHGARMSAMDNATKNASELIDQYTLRRNRARQAAITTELIEIVAGAEALK